MFNESHLQHYKLFGRIFEQAPIGMALVCMDGTLKKVNPALCHMLGYSEDELTNLTFQSVTHPDDLEQTMVCQDKALKGIVNGYPFEKKYIHKSGKVIWGLLNVAVERDQQGNTNFFIFQLVDITDRKEMEMLLRESEQRYKSLVQNAPVAICSVDLEGNFIEVNPEYEQMTGYSSEELLSMNLMDFELPKKYQEANINLINSFKKTLQFDGIQIKHKDGSQIDTVIVSSPIIVNGEVKGIYYMIRDVSEQIQTEGLLRNSEKLSIVGELAAGIAHEIRNPLTILRGFIQLYQSEDTTGMKKPRHDLMLSEIDRINEIVSELLVLAKPSKESFELRSISKKLDHVVTLFEAEANLRNVVIRSDIDPDLPSINSQSSLKQVFINLLKNSIEAMHRGGEVLVQAKRIEDKVCIQVIDQGCGISQDQLSKIGQPFFTTKETGTGLGLMVSQRIIQNHKGTMRIKSEVGRGTVVEIMLPVIKI